MNERIRGSSDPEPFEADIPEELEEIQLGPKEIDHRNPFRDQRMGRGPGGGSFLRSGETAHGGKVFKIRE